jgi:hypothetical protein
MQHKVENQETEGSFLLKLFQLEKLVNRYKYQLIAVVSVLFLGFVAIQVNNYLTQQNLIKTNEAYNRLLVNPDDKKALVTLKENRKLYKLYLLQTSNGDIKKLEKVAQGTGIISNIAKYQLAMIKGDKKDIENYALSIGAIYKDLALLNLERLYLKDGNHKKAEESAKQIKDEQISKLADGLLHYGIVK